MKILITAVLLIASSHLALAECANEMEAFSRHQDVMRGMLDMHLKGDLDSENSRAIGKRLNLGQQAQKEGEYAKACKIYDSITEDYGFQKASAPKDVKNESVEEVQSEAEAVPTTESSTSATAAEEAPKSDTEQ